MVYRKILVPYDIFNPADNALEHAIKLAKAGSDTEVILLHVITEIPVYPLMEHAIKSRKGSKLTAFQEHVEYVYSAMKDRAIKTLDDKKHEYERAEGKKIKSDIILGKPIDKIVEYAEREGVELIIMGSTGYGGIAKKLRILGSVSKGVLEKAKCPVMVVS